MPEWRKIIQGELTFEEAGSKLARFSKVQFPSSTEFDLLYLITCDSPAVRLVKSSSERLRLLLGERFLLSLGLREVPLLSKSEIFEIDVELALESTLIYVQKYD